MTLLTSNTSDPGASSGNLFNQATELEDRENDAHSDKADDAAHEDDHQRLDHGGDALDYALELFGVELAHLVENLAELTGLFAGTDHLHHRAGKESDLLQRLADLLPLLHRAVHAAPHPFVHDVAADVGSDGDGVQHWDAGV